MIILYGKRTNDGCNEMKTKLNLSGFEMIVSKFISCVPNKVKLDIIHFTLVAIARRLIYFIHFILLEMLMFFSRLSYTLMGWSLKEI